MVTECFGGTQNLLMNLGKDMTLAEVINYIAGKHNNIEIVNDNEFDINGIVCMFNGLKICFGYPNQEVVFYKNIVFNHKVSSNYNGNFNSRDLTTDKIDKLYEIFMNTYRQACLDLKEIKIDESIEEIKKDFV
jgi:hypothetical protein